MGTNTPILGLNLWDPNDRLSFKALNKDNETLEDKIGPVFQEGPIVSSAARINAYNNMKNMRYIDSLGHSTAEKIAMFFDNFDSAAPFASDGALLMTEKHGYVFSPSNGTSIANGQPGDVGTTTGESTASFSFAAPASGYIQSVELDIKAKATGYTTYLYKLVVGDYQSKYNLNFGDTPTTRGTQIYTFSEPVAVHKGEIVSGYVRTGSNPDGAEIYGAKLNEPYIKFNIVPATEKGWIKTEVSDLGNMGHKEVRAYIQGIKEDAGSITATLISSDGTETLMEPVGTRNTVTPADVSCVELEFVATFNKTGAQLRIDVDASSGYADVYNYAVIGI